ncbi:MAG: 50S ribosomal protein L24 [Desulfobacterales bacterium]
MKFDKVAIRKDDKVKVLTGKDRGKIGKVLQVFRKKERILVEKVNLIKKHTRPSAKNRQGGIVEAEAPIHWSNVLLICNKCMAATRVRFRTLEDGKKQRICVKCGEAVES